MHRVAHTFVLLLALLALLPTGVQADHGDVHVECDADDNPVVTDWGPLQPGDPEWMFVCIEGDPQIIHIIPPGPTVDPLQTTYKRPDDWAGWVGVDINGYPMVNPYKGEANPYIVKGTNRVVVPVRIISEAIGAEVKWNEARQEVTIRWRDTEIYLTIGSTEARVNGEPVTLDQPAVIWEGRTFVPLRFVVETFGATVEWDNFSYLANLLMPGVACRKPYCLHVEEGTLDANRP